IGDITNFRGTITGTIANAASVGNITLQKSGSDLKIKNADKVGKIIVNTGTKFTLDDTNGQFQGVQTQGGTSDITLNASTYVSHQIQTTKGTTNIAFSSTPSSINFDNTKLQNLITTLTPKKDETSQ
ncbi:hypothetical protein, partial [Helicobacter sp. 12S02232-10]|uniref:hypothetical protein n=1 Tax=Helicobacter sp. 12S02232-10 TaxID=1476197 RepID=UPI0015DEAC92